MLCDWLAATRQLSAEANQLSAGASRLTEHAEIKMECVG